MLWICSLVGGVPVLSAFAFLSGLRPSDVSQDTAGVPVQGASRGTGSADALFGLNTFILQQRLQAAHRDRGRVVPGTVHRQVVAARTNRRLSKGDRPGVQRDPTWVLEQELGSVGSSEQSPSTPSSSSLGERTR